MDSLVVAVAYGVAGSAPFAAAKLGLDITRLRPAIGWAITFTCIFNTHPWLRLLAVPHVGFALFTMSNPYVFFRKFLHLPAFISVVVAAFGGVAPQMLPASTAVSTLAIALQTIHFLIGFARFMILPATLVSSIARIDDTRAKFLQANAGWERISIPCSSHQGVLLDGIVFQNPSAKGKRWVIYLGGNGEVYEHTTDIVTPMAKFMHANILVYNPRGVGHSGGEIRGAEDLVNDASDAIRFLLEKYSAQGLRESHILLYGHSIGGAVASQIVSRKHPECSLVVDRSFATLVDACVSLGPIKNRQITDFGVKLIFGDMDTVSAIPKLTHNRVLFTYHQQDGVLRLKQCSLVGLHREKLKGYEIIEFTGPSQDPHNVPPSTFAEFSQVVASCDRFFTQGEGRKLGGK